MSKPVLIVGGREISFVSEEDRAKAEKVLRDFAEPWQDSWPKDTVSAYLHSGRPLCQSGMDLKNRSCMVMHVELRWDRTTPEAEKGRPTDDGR